MSTATDRRPTAARTALGGSARVASAGRLPAPARAAAGTGAETRWHDLPREHRITQVFRTRGGGLVAEYDPD